MAMPTLSNIMSILKIYIRNFCLNIGPVLIVLPLTLAHKHEEAMFDIWNKMLLVILLMLKRAFKNPFHQISNICRHNNIYVKMMVYIYINMILSSTKVSPWFNNYIYASKYNQYTCYCFLFQCLDRLLERGEWLSSFMIRRCCLASNVQDAAHTNMMTE